MGAAGHYGRYTPTSGAAVMIMGTNSTGLAQQVEDVFRKRFGDIVLLFLHFLSEFMMFEMSPFLPHRKEKFLSSFVI